MNHKMPVLTAKQREKLINTAKEDINFLEGIQKRRGHLFDLELEKLALIRIALAALTAEPVVEVTKWMPLGIDGGASKFLNPIGDLPDYGSNLYTAPPVPVMQAVTLDERYSFNFCDRLERSKGGCLMYTDHIIEAILAAGGTVEGAE